MNIKDMLNKGKSKSMTEEDIVRIHELFMSEYGWISIEEFNHMKIPTFFNILFSLINRKDSLKKRGNSNEW